MRQRSPATASAQDRGSRWAVIAGIWSSVVLGIGLASAFRMSAFTVGRTALVGPFVL